MGLTMHLFGVESEHGKTPVGHGIIRTMYEVGYWRKAWIILYWFGREFEIDDDVECITLNFGSEVLEILARDCRYTIAYYDKYESCHRNGTVEDEIPDNCLLGGDWDYLFYNRYTKGGYINELEYTIELCERLLSEDKYDDYAFEASV